MKTIDQLIVELKKIKKEELTQRRFYEEIFSTLIECICQVKNGPFYN